MRTRPGTRVRLVVEDQRTERFFRRLLEHLGVHPRAIHAIVAPKGGGSAAAWVLQQLPAEVQQLRSRNFQPSLALVVVRDGDNQGPRARKAELSSAMEKAGLAPRGPEERIAWPVPCWSIETWLLELLGLPRVDEQQRQPESGKLWKELYEALQVNHEGAKIAAAVRAWPGTTNASSAVPSLADGVDELSRI